MWSRECSFRSLGSARDHVQLLANFDEYYPGIPSEGDIKETNEGWKRNAWGLFGENTANNILFQAMKPADHVAMKSGQQSNY